MNLVPDSTRPWPVHEHVVHFSGIAHDGILSGLHFVDEVVNLYHVHALIVDAHKAAHTVELGSEEYAYDGINGLVGDDIHGDLERVIVKAAHAANV